MSTNSNEGSRIPDKKKNDLLKKFLNAQQYTKTLKKNASNLVQETNYATFSYDQIPTYPQIPQSAKLPSTKLFSKELIQSIETLNNDSQQFNSIKAKSKKSHGHIHQTQSSNDIPYLKNQKSSYSPQVEKSQGNKSINSKIMIRESPAKANKQFDVKSMNKEKYQKEVLHESLGGIKTDSYFKQQSKKSFNYSNIHEYESQKLSAQDKHSYEKLNRKAKRMEGSYADLVRQETNQEFLSPYNLSPTNFIKLINKVQQLQSVILLYQQAINMMKKKIVKQLETIRSQEMSQIFVDQLKNQLIEEKGKSSQLRDNLYLQDTQIKEYEKVMLQSIEKVSKHYEHELSKITILQKENHFLKFMLRLQIQQNPEINKNNTNKPQSIEDKKNSDDDSKQVSGSKIHISKNINEFKDKFTKVILDKNKTKIN